LVVKHLSEAELESLIKHERSKRLVERLVFIQSLYAGEEVETAAKKVGRCRATGYWWLKRWNARGLEGLKPAFGGGRPPKLSSVERAELKQELQSRSYWFMKEVRKLIQDKFGKELSPASVSRILRSFGMKYAKPYPRDYRRPDDAETKLENALRTSLGKLDDLEAKEDVLVGFLDESRPQSSANTVRVWSFDKVSIVKDTTKYQANTFGFYAPYGTSVVAFMENSKKESVCNFLEEIRMSNPEAQILLILDNFSSHKAQITREKAEQLGIFLTYLPPYSPDLNPIEQIWRCLKREISTAIFRSKEEFLTIIKNSYKQLSRKLSFSTNWFQKFLPQLSNKLCN